MLSAAARRCHCGPLIPVFPFSSPPSNLLTPFPIGNRWETFAAGYCQMEQILITTSASSVYSLPASPPPRCTISPFDVFDTCFRCRHVVLICLVLLITGYLSSLAQNGKHTECLCRAAHSDILPCGSWPVRNLQNSSFSCKKNIILQKGSSKF